MLIPEHFCRQVIVRLVIALLFVSPLADSFYSNAQISQPGPARFITQRGNLASALLPEKIEPIALGEKNLSPVACNTQTISFGQTINDRLNNSDCGTDRLYDQYQFDGLAGQAIDISMSSSVFDTNIELYGPDGQRIALNSGGAGGRNSRILITLPTAGTYLIQASSLSLHETGSYSIRLGNARTISGHALLLINPPPTPLDNAVIVATNLAGTFSTSTVSATDGTYILILPDVIDSYAVTASRPPFTPQTQVKLFNDLTENQIYDVFFVVITGGVNGRMGVRAFSTAGLRMVASGPGIAPFDCFLTEIDSTVHEIGYACQGLPPIGTITFTRTSIFVTFEPAALTIQLDGNLQGFDFPGPSYVINPMPGIVSLSPAATAAGSGPLTVHVAGSNFVSGSVIKWNGQDCSTTFVSPTQLTAEISAEDLQFGGYIPVSAFNPPYGGGASNSVNFSVNGPFVFVGGKVTTPDGRGLRNASVRLANPTDPLFVPRTVTTTSFGSYSFDNIPTGATYTLSVASKLYRFSSQQMLVNGNLANVDFVGQE